MRHAAAGSTRTLTERRPAGRRRASSRHSDAQSGAQSGAVSGGGLPGVVTAGVEVAGGRDMAGGASRSLPAATDSSGPTAADRPLPASADQTGSDAAPTPSHALSDHGGARAEQLPYSLVLIGIVLAVVTIRASSHVLKSGTLVLAGVLLLAAVARLCLPDRRAGMLSSRRRLLDVAIFAALGVGLLVAGLVIPAAG